MQARARRLERKMQDDNVRRMLRYLAKYITKVTRVCKKAKRERRCSRISIHSHGLDCNEKFGHKSKAGHGEPSLWVGGPPQISSEALEVQ